MPHSLLAVLALVAVVSISTIQAAPVPTIDTRPAYCPGVTPNNDTYLLHLAAYTLQHGGSVTLPVNLTYEDLSTTRMKLLDAQAYGSQEPTTTSCLEAPTPFTPPQSNPGVCSVQYQCDYDVARFPPYIHHVVCNNKEVVRYAKAGNGADYIGECECQPIYRPLTVLRFAGCDPYEQWEMEEQVVSVGCSCVNIP